jgi:hypothetical protein
MNNPPTILDWITAIGTVATPIMVLVLTAMGWTIRRRIEKGQEKEKYLRELEEKLRDSRIEIYYKVIDPFIIGLSNDAAFSADKSFKGKSAIEIAQQKMFSLEYKQAALRLSLIGSDSVTRAYNNLMQQFYSNELQQGSPESSLKLMGILGNLLLEIRKSVGNENTELDNLEMLEWFINDIRKYRK